MMFLFQESLICPKRPNAQITADQKTIVNN